MTPLEGSHPSDRSQEIQPEEASLNRRPHTFTGPSHLLPAELKGLIGRFFNRDSRSEDVETAEKKENFLREKVRKCVEEGDINTEDLLAFRKTESPDSTIGALNIKREDLVEAVSGYMERLIASLRPRVSKGDEVDVFLDEVWGMAQKDKTSAFRTKNSGKSNFDRFIRNDYLDTLIIEARLFYAKVVEFEEKNLFAVPPYAPPAENQSPTHSGQEQG